ncbi:MAG: dihydroorotase [Tidjanibacter sp.]|nr:dihydroorotase [Tidjanibacter sp.]
MIGRLILKGGTICRASGSEVGDVLVENGVVRQIGGTVELKDGDEVYDVAGKCVMSGLVDVHVHLREPGFSYKETIESGTKAAARGGFTTVCSMPNLNPAPDTLDNLSEQLKLIRDSAVVKVVPYGTITERRAGSQVVDMAAMKPYVAAFTDDGSGVQAEGVMELAMQKAAENDVLIAAHCEVESLLHGGCIHDGEFAAQNGFKGICSESEWREVERDIELAEKTGCRFHVCHVSTKESVELVRKAKERGLPVTCETGPHYLTMCDMDLKDEGRFKMNPPLRSAFDRAALIAGIKDGTVEIIATDHAPHSAEEKSRGLVGSAMGVVGLETSFAVVYSRLVKTGVITMERMVELMTDNPRRIFGLEGGLEVGAAADIAVFDTEVQYKVNPEEFVSMGKSTPFEGWDVQGCAVMTLVNGEVVYKAEA